MSKVVKCWWLAEVHQQLSLPDFHTTLHISKPLILQLFSVTIFGTCSENNVSSKKVQNQSDWFFCTFSYHDVLPCAFLQSAFVFLLGNNSEFSALSADCHKKGSKIAASVRFHFKSEKTNCNCKIMITMRTLVMVRSY